MANCTVPIRIDVYLLSVTLTFETQSVTGRTMMSVLSRAKTRLCPTTWSPVSVAMAVPTGPSSSPMMTSGSEAVLGGPPATSASPARRMMRSLITVGSMGSGTRAPPLGA